MNGRQSWILAQIEKGVPLRLKDIISHTRKNRSTINRDLKELRQRGLVGLHGEGYYIQGMQNSH
ncbi:MAG: ArsR family transcriptional regulator [Planctomycetota bacterium]